MQIQVYKCFCDFAIGHGLDPHDFHETADAETLVEMFKESEQAAFEKANSSPFSPPAIVPQLQLQPKEMMDHQWINRPKATRTFATSRLSTA